MQEGKINKFKGLIQKVTAPVFSGGKAVRIYNPSQERNVAAFAFYYYHSVLFPLIEELFSIRGDEGLRVVKESMIIASKQELRSGIFYIEDSWAIEKWNIRIFYKYEKRLESHIKKLEKC